VVEYRRGCRRWWTQFVVVLVALVGSVGCAGPAKFLGRQQPMEYRVPTESAKTALAAEVYTVLAGVDGAHNHFPGPDGLVGTGDDLVSAFISPILGSDANFRGSFSFVAGTLPTAPGDPTYFPGTHNGGGFCEGTITIDEVVAGVGGGPLILDWNLVGTAPIQGQGASFLEMLAVNGGTYNPISGAITLDHSPELTTGGQVVSDPSIVSTGTAMVLDAPFPVTGNSYVDSVLVPLAQSLGATGLFFAELDTTVPGTITIETSSVLVAVRGVAAATDVTLAAAVDPPAGSIPGSQVTVTLTATNNGPLDATTSMTTVFMPVGLSWTSGDCGGPPVGDELAWTIGTLSNGGSTQCSFIANIDPAAPFDLEFGASLYMDEVDTAPDDNFVSLLVEVVSGGAEGLEQVVAAAPGLFPADADCDNCTSGMQTLAGNFKVNNQFTLANLGFSGVYTDNNAFSDQFTIEIHGDTGKGLGPRSPNVPGPVVATLAGSPTRTATGNLIFGAFDEYEYSLPAALDLGRGRYWMAIFNDSSSAGGAGDWVWLTGDPDPLDRSLATMAASAASPPTIRWGVNPDPTTHLAFTLTAGAVGAPTGIPAMDLSATTVFLVLIGVIGGALLRRRML